MSEGRAVAVIDDRSSGAAVELDELGVVTPEVERRSDDEGITALLNYGGPSFNP